MLEPTFGRSVFTVLFIVSILGGNKLWRQIDHFVPPRSDYDRGYDLVGIGDSSILVLLSTTILAMYLLG